MSYKLEYIGPTQTIKAAALYSRNPNDFIDIKLEKDKQYIVELENDGPVMVANGQTLIPPESTIWMIFPSFSGGIAYSPEAILRQWRII